MIINVTYRFDAEVIAPRQRNARSRSFVETIPVEIREPSPSEAPVALAFTADQWFDHAPGQRLELRWFDDTLYRKAFEVTRDKGRDEPPVVAPRGADWIVRCAEGGYKDRDNYRAPLPVGTKPYDEAGEPMRIDEDPRVARVKSSKQVERRSEVLAAADALILVDGEVHVACTEPVYRYSGGSFFGGGRDRSVAPEFLDKGNRNQHCSNLFRADEYDFMVENRRLDADELGGTIEVLIPEAVRYDGPAQVMLGAAADLRDWMRERVADRDMAFFATFMRLRDQLAAETAHRTGLKFPPADCGEVAEMVRAALEDLGPDCGYERHRVRSALERVDARALSFEPGFAP